MTPQSITLNRVYEILNANERQIGDMDLVETTDQELFDLLFDLDETLSDEAFLLEAETLDMMLRTGDFHDVRRAFWAVA